MLERFQSREQQRTRRPLMLLGVVALVLMLAVMAPLFVSTMRTSVRTVNSELTKRALESDALTARVQAQSLEDELNRRISELQDVLVNPSLIGSLESATRRPGDEVANEFLKVLDGELAGDDVPQWIRALDAAFDRIDERARNRGGSRDTSWFLTNANGQQLWRRGAGDTKGSIEKKHYWYRDYYHGGGANLAHSPLQPRPDDVSMFDGKSHVSVAFRSTATNRYMVAVTVKIFDKSGQNVIGLLGRTTHLDEFRGRFISSGRGQKQRTGTVKREIALVDARDWHLLDHSWIAAVIEASRTEDDAEYSEELRTAATALKQDPDAFYASLEIERPVQREFAGVKTGEDGHRSLRLEFYADPVGKKAEEYAGPWLAALHEVKVGDAPWIVIVQESRDAALGSVNAMSDSVTWYGLLAIFVSVIVIMGVWLFVISTIRNFGQRPESGAAGK